MNYQAELAALRARLDREIQRLASQGLSINQIAHETGCHPSTVHERLNAAAHERYAARRRERYRLVRDGRAA